MQQAGSISSEENLRTYIQSIIPIIIQLKRSQNPARFVEITEIYCDTAEDSFHQQHLFAKLC